MLEKESTIIELLPTWRDRCTCCRSVLAEKGATDPGANFEQLIKRNTMKRNINRWWAWTVHPLWQIFLLKYKFFCQTIIPTRRVSIDVDLPRLDGLGSVYLWTEN